MPLGFLLLILASAAAQDSISSQSVAEQPLHTLVTPDDYPPEAIGRNEQGTVGFKLSLGQDGKPRGCSIVSSSGSASLDATSCRIMMERARFRPAHDAQGRPIASEISQRLRWALPDTDMSPATHAAFMLWMSCAVGEAAKLALTDLSAEQVAATSFPLCSALEAVVAREIEQPAPLTEQRVHITRMIERGLVQARTALAQEER